MPVRQDDLRYCGRWGLLNDAARRLAQWAVRKYSLDLRVEGAARPRKVGVLEPNADRACGWDSSARHAKYIVRTARGDQVGLKRSKSTKSGASMYKIACYTRNARDQGKSGQV